ncbi:LysR family transcriptional regulator [Rubrivivax albus]|nr:LysR family transcriptional regulator [Rubrivivax albus]
MELKWLDDYIALIDTGSFSAAAQRRHVSQPAFSRRIQMLEAWLGVTLIDRSRKPLRMTPLAAEHQRAFRSLVARIYEFRATLNAAAVDGTGITIAAQHTLAAAYVPGVLARLQSLNPGQRYRIRSENRTDSVAMLMRGQAEILITYETAQTPCGIPAALARREVLGRDELVLVANPGLHDSLSRAVAASAVPMLCFPPESFFGQVVRADAMPELMRQRPVVVRCVSEFAMGLRELALIGQGAAWLPASLIHDDLRHRRLLPLPALGQSVAMDIVAYLATPEGLDRADLEARLQALRAAGAARSPRRPRRGGL